MNKPFDTLPEPRYTNKFIRLLLLLLMQTKTLHRQIQLPSHVHRCCLLWMHSRESAGKATQCEKILKLILHRSKYIFEYKRASANLEALMPKRVQLVRGRYDDFWLNSNWCDEEKRINVINSSFVHIRSLHHLLLYKEIEKKKIPKALTT